MNEVEIYGEYLFLENFITGILLLLLTGRLSGQHPGKIRLLAGGLICGMSGFLILLPIQGAASVGIRLVISIFVTITVFGGSSLRIILKKTCLFLGFTFLSGGAAMAFLLWQQIPAISGGGALYVQLYTYGRLICYGILAFVLTDGFIYLLQNVRMEKATRGRLKIFLNDQVFEMSAILDTGNYLKEPFSGRPVILVDKIGATKFPDRKTEAMKSRTAAIPYRAVGTDHGILLGFRSDKAIFEGRQIKGAVIGFYEGTFQEAEAIVNREVLNCCIFECERRKDKYEHEHESSGKPDSAGIYKKAGRKALRRMGRIMDGQTAQGNLLHRRKRCASASAATCRRSEDAGGICGGESGCQERDDRE